MADTRRQALCHSDRDCQSDSEAARRGGIYLQEACSYGRGKLVPARARGRGGIWLLGRSAALPRSDASAQHSRSPPALSATPGRGAAGQRCGAVGGLWCCPLPSAPARRESVSSLFLRKRDSRCLREDRRAASAGTDDHPTALHPNKKSGVVGRVVGHYEILVLYLGSLQDYNPVLCQNNPFQAAHKDKITVEMLTTVTPP